MSPAQEDPPPASAESAEPAPRVPLALEDVLTAAVMAALALITFANVLVRYFTSQSFAWTEEVSVFLMIVLALVASSAASRWAIRRLGVAVPMPRIARLIGVLRAIRRR